MKILILSDRKGDFLSGELGDFLKKSGHNICSQMLSLNEFKPCIGCFGCWVKTPGQCVITGDRANSIAAMIMDTDAVILVSKITFGGFSADIKAFLDRSIQNIMPFFEIHKGEMHHVKRYEHFPAWIAVGYGDVSEAQKQTFLSLKERNVLNKRPEYHLALTIQNENEIENKAQEIIKLLEEAGA